MPSLRDCWSADLGHPDIIGIMSRNRFQNIMQHLRFDDKFTREDRAKTDKFAAMSDVWGSFVTNCLTSCNPGRHITIDEQLFPSKTRCCFLQYIATKPDKFGIKFWVACDLKSKYICNVFPYLGKDPSRPSGERLSETVVMRLMEPFLDKGRNVTTDNFFTSLSLAKRLLERKTTILGTVNKIRREIPPSTRRMDRNEFTTQLFSTTGATLTVYTPNRKKAVYILSSMHNLVQTEDTTKRKPNTVTLFNTTKCGVDIMDQMYELMGAVPQEILQQTLREEQQVQEVLTVTHSRDPSMNPLVLGRLSHCTPSPSCLTAPSRLLAESTA
uniref:PiggyBac transposable element-derived protein domain-containing protein n=1 Tax=Knipowitschia caucasica TaxID=637954 RepID=A0AAV2L9F1_KNICA